ncbi:S26 family signal peptidase [Rhodoplanes elegans]|uniref:S26 family signal peptidase n=1 Tax=Rhodoplanes elegans TaxID=29408 RepID=A0A327KY19_9BRAD|nr:S26 family signal peptidase [Rhodoplanes elegans]MBK5958396.1 S26 family signal peptidase [Rhodoplanes elegans]RAI42062.1 S26 family signal peptidase [Rhodoplanes elegans]
MSGRLLIIATTATAAIVVLSTIGPKPRPSFVWNVSASVPTGLYAVEPARKLAVTDLVVAVPPEPLAKELAERGALPAGVPLIKRVLALPGQTVCRTGLEIAVDALAMGQALERDRHGRPLASWDGCRVLRHGEVFLMNWDEPLSFDGRYFGPLPVSSVVGRAIPVWVSEE